MGCTRIQLLPENLVHQAQDLRSLSIGLEKMSKAWKTTPSKCTILYKPGTSQIVAATGWFTSLGMEDTRPYG